MRCVSCGFDNRDGAKFCNECGTALTNKEKVKRQKSNGKSENSKDKRQSKDSELRTRDAERRQLTVMFCDLVGSTALSTQLDPEELREVEREYQRLCGTVIHRFEGYLAKYLGDGLLVYFGYPIAHEDDAARAVRAGLEIVERIHTIRTPLPVLQGEGWSGGRLQVRIGIHTGLVVAGEMGTEDQPEHLAIVGETPNLAARIQGQANPDEVVISAATYRLVEGLFDCAERGQPELKGVAVPLGLYRVVKEDEARSRFEVVVRKGLTPLIGRNDEVRLLRERWTRARQGTGQVVLLSGEPGIGKSRLAQALKEDVIQDGATAIEFRCSPYYQNTAWYPIIEHLQRVLQFDREDVPHTKIAKLQNSLTRYRFLKPETVTLFATLLSLPYPEGYPLITLSPQKQRQCTQEALVAWIVEEAERQAMASIWEDLHWADPSTLELLQLYLDQVPTNQIFTLLTFRPEFQPSWPLRSHMSQITLGRLERTQVEEIVEKVTGGKALPTEVVKQIVMKTDGVPLFVEELTKSVVESVGTHGRVPLQVLTIPTTLQDSLMARLDRLGGAKAVAQLGATLGREFSYELLHAVSPRDEEALQRELCRLVEAELVYQRGLPPQAQYSFKHALIQDTAYQSLLKSTRQQYHSQIAQVLEEKFLEMKESQPELLARHYTEAGLVAQAIPYWHKAGQKATQRSANVEAISHLTRGLELLKTMPDIQERAQQELILQIALGIPLVATKGFAAPEVEWTYARARALCQQVGESRELFTILMGLQSVYLVRGDARTAREFAERLVRLAENVQDTNLMLQAYSALGVSSYFLGDLVSAVHYFEKCLAVYDPQQHSSHVFAYRIDPGVACLGHFAVVLSLLGYPDQALKRVREGLSLSRAGAHLLSLGFALNAVAGVHYRRREFLEALGYAEEAIALCREREMPQFVAWGLMEQGGAMSGQGRSTEGIALMQQGLAAHRTTGAEFLAPAYLIQLAEAYGRARRPEDGLVALDEAFTLIAKNGECFYEAELYRLKGTLTLQQEGKERGAASKEQEAKSEEQGVKSKEQKSENPNPNSQIPKPPLEAETCFQKAIEIARKQQAKSWELRASMSLARLWQQQSKKAEAHKLLSEIYNWFTEGFDTKDLQEAKELLDSLASSV